MVFNRRDKEQKKEEVEERINTVAQNRHVPYERKRKNNQKKRRGGKENYR